MSQLQMYMIQHSTLVLGGCRIADPDAGLIGQYARQLPLIHVTANPYPVIWNPPGELYTLPVAPTLTIDLYGNRTLPFLPVSPWSTMIYDPARVAPPNQP